MKKIYIYGKVCERRLLDAKKIQFYFKENKYEIVSNPINADIIILVTCAVYEDRTKIALNRIKEFQKYKAELIVSGCLPDIEKEKLAKIFDGITISTKNLDKLDSLFPNNKIKFKDIDDQNILFQNLDESKPSSVFQKIIETLPFIQKIYVNSSDIIYKGLFNEKSQFYRMLTKKPLYHIRTSRGCLGNCSYCVIKKATGTIRSKPVDHCINELKNGLNKGYKNFVLIGTDVGAYGLDGSSNFPEFLDKMTSIPGDYSLSIDSLNPRWVIKYITDLEDIIKGGKITSIEIPIQSGNSRILKLMHRYSNIDKLKDTFLRLKLAFPDLLIRTHVIIGFPTETDEELQETLSFIKEIDFSAGVLYPFSCHPDAIAENIGPKIKNKEILRRIKYSKNYFKNQGYRVYHRSSMHFFLFEKKSF